MSRKEMRKRIVKKLVYEIRTLDNKVSAGWDKIAAPNPATVPQPNVMATSSAPLKLAFFSSEILL